MGITGYINKGTERERVCGGFRSWYAHCQQERPQLCRVGDHEDIETSDDGQRRGANKWRSHGICQRIGLIRDGYASWRNTRSSFSRETLRRSWENLPLDQRSKTTSHKRIDCIKSHCVPFVVPGLSTSSCATPTPASASSSSEDSAFDSSRDTEKSSTRKKWKY